MNKRLVVFLHIPKCAGHSFISVLRRNFEHVSKFPHGGDLNWDKVDAIHGHFQFSMAENFPAFRHREKIYMTFLRNPIDRVISWYYHTKKRESIQEWLTKPNHFKSNAMVHYLGDGDLAMAVGRIVNGIIYRGFTECFSESLQYFSQECPPLQDITWQIENKGKYNKGAIYNDKKTIKMIEELNQEDIELYDTLFGHLLNHPDGAFYARGEM